MGRHIREDDGHVGMTVGFNHFDDRIEVTQDDLDRNFRLIRDQGPPELVTPLNLNNKILRDYIREHAPNILSTKKGKGAALKTIMAVDSARELKRQGVKSIHDLDKHALIFCDADIKRFTFLEIIKGLAAPIFDGNIFSKASFTRVSKEDNKLKGRLTDVLISPFVESLVEVSRKIGEEKNIETKAVEILGLFRYVCSGEVGMNMSTGFDFLIPDDFGVEAMMLVQAACKLSRNNGKLTAADVFIGEYDHEHSPAGSLGSMAKQVLTGFINAFSRFGILDNSKLGHKIKDDIIERTVIKLLNRIESRELLSRNNELAETVMDDIDLSKQFIAPLFATKRTEISEEDNTAKAVGGIYEMSCSLNPFDLLEIAEDEDSWKIENYEPLDPKE